MKLFHKRNDKHRQWVTLTGFLVLGFLFRLFLMRYHFAIGWDEPHYLQMAASFASGRFMQGLHTYWTPMYPVCVAVFSFVFPNFEIAGRMVSMTCGTLVLLPIFFLAKKLFGSACAFWTIGLLALSPSFAFLSTEALAEPMFILFVVMGVAAGWKALESDSIRTSLLTAVLFGISYYTKPEGIGFWGIYVAVAGLWGIVDLIKTKGKKKILIAVVSTVGFFIVACPYLLYLHGQTGRWTLHSKAFAAQQLGVREYSDSGVNYGQLSDDHALLARDAIYHQGNFLKSINENRQPTRSVNISILFRKFIINFYRTLKYAIPQTMGAVILILFFLGLFRSAWPLKKIGITLYLLSFVAAFWLFFIPLFFIVDRYFLPGLTICFVWIGKGAVELTSWTKDTFRSFFQKKPLSSIRIIPESKSIVVVLAVIFFFSWLPEFGRVIARNEWSDQYWDEAVELKIAGLWLKAHASHESKIMSQNKSVNFYAGCTDVRKSYSFSIDSFDDILAYARHQGVEYMVIAERYKASNPNLTFLFGDEGIPDALKLVYENREHKGLSVRIFQVTY
ncbi:MAG: glycosyltransferase family 39 protein [bacterium]